MPSFVFYLDAKVEVPGTGTIAVDVAYGGMIYAAVDADTFSFAVGRARDLVELGERIKGGGGAAARPSIRRTRIHTINQTQFAAPLQLVGGQKTARNAVIVSPGRIDRSPCGTGTCARLAIMQARVRSISAGFRP